jgi:hypothetical protein
VSNQLQPPAAFNSWFKKTVFGIHRVGGWAISGYSLEALDKR